MIHHTLPEKVCKMHDSPTTNLTAYPAWSIAKGAQCLLDLLQPQHVRDGCMCRARQVCFVLCVKNFATRVADRVERVMYILWKVCGFGRRACQVYFVLCVLNCMTRVDVDTKVMVSSVCRLCHVWAAGAYVREDASWSYVMCVKNALVKGVPVDASWSCAECVWNVITFCMSLWILIDHVLSVLRVAACRASLYRSYLFMWSVRRDYQSAVQVHVDLNWSFVRCAGNIRVLCVAQEGRSVMMRWVVSSSAVFVSWKPMSRTARCKPWKGCQMQLDGSNSDVLTKALGCLRASLSEKKKIESRRTQVDPQ